MIISNCGHLYKSKGLGRLLVWMISECVKILPMRTDISSYLREAIAAALQSGKGYEAILPSALGRHLL